MGISSLTPAVFLDRDGVLNDVVTEGGISRPPPGIESFHLLPGVEEACRALAAGGYALVVVTNQPDVARGTQRREIVEAMNALVVERLPIRRVYTCYHDDVDACPCRKPKPGMLLQAADELRLDPERSFMVGDRCTDVMAGGAAGCRTIFVTRGHGVADRCRPDWVVSDLPSAAQIILREEFR